MSISGVWEDEAGGKVETGNGKERVKCWLLGDIKLHVELEFDMPGGPRGR